MSRAPRSKPRLAVSRTAIRINGNQSRKLYMKLLSICLFAAGLLAFLSGCASGDSGYYSPGQLAAQHSSYEPHP